MREAAHQVRGKPCRDAGFGLGRIERVRGRMVLSRRISLVQAGLRDNHRPIRPRAPHRTQGLEDRALLRVHGARDGQHQMRAFGAERQVLCRVVVGLAQSARVEEAQDGRLLGKIEDARRAGARLEAAAERHVVALGDGAYDRALAALHLADQPNDRSEGARAFGNGVSLRLRCARALRPELRNQADSVWRTNRRSTLDPWDA